MARPDGARADEREQRELFEVLYADYLRTETIAGGACERHYRIGRGTVRFRFAGAALLPVAAPALEHLTTPPVPEPALTIHLWDRVSGAPHHPLLLTGLMQALSWRWHDHLDSRGEVAGYNSPRMRAAFHPGPNILSLLDLQQQRAIYWANDASEVPWHEMGSPLRNILSWWAASEGYQFVHAAAVGRDSGAVLIVGKGGSGKSTTALACLAAGLRYVGDDYTLVGSHEGPMVYGLYNTAKLTGPPDLARFPDLADSISNPERLATEKAMIFLGRHHPDRLAAALPLRAILVPRITHQPGTSVHAITAGAALAALAPSTLLQLPGSDTGALQAMAALVRRVPCYELRLGNEIARIPAVISNLLTELGG